MNIIFRIFLLLLFFTTTSGQGPAIEWQRCYGGSNNDFPRRIIEGRNNDLIVVGHTLSTDGDIIGGNDSMNIFWLRLDTLGNIINRRVLGAAGKDNSEDVIAAWDNGYIILGNTSSVNGVTNQHGWQDVWTVKISIQGVPQWEKCFGGSDFEVARSIIKTHDSCYVICGSTYSSDGDVSFNHGTSDLWLFKIDKTGNLLWEKTYGDGPGDYGEKVIQTTDSGFLVCGSTFSDSGQVSGNNGSQDFWILKTDAQGNMQWAECFGGGFLEGVQDVVELNDYYFIFGTNNSDDGDVSNNHLDGTTPTPDAWLICIDTAGQLQWERSLGGSWVDSGRDIVFYWQSLFLGAYAGSSDGDVTNHPGLSSSDFWIIQTDTSGNILWNNCYGGTGHDYLESMVIVGNNLYALGQTESNDIDVSGNHGGIDYWLFNINIDSLTNNINTPDNKNSFSFFPNPANDFIHIKTERNAILKIYNMQGKLIMSDVVENQSTKDITELSNGVYLLECVYNDLVREFNYLIISH
jgi:hypothetical protein